MVSENIQATGLGVWRGTMETEIRFTRVFVRRRNKETETFIHISDEEGHGSCQRLEIRKVTSKRNRARIRRVRTVSEMKGLSMALCIA